MLERGTPEFYSLLPEGDERILPGTRAIIWVDIHQGEHYLNLFDTKQCLTEYFAIRSWNELRLFGAFLRLSRRATDTRQLLREMARRKRCTAGRCSIQTYLLLEQEKRTVD